MGASAVGLVAKKPRALLTVTPLGLRLLYELLERIVREATKKAAALLARKFGAGERTAVARSGADRRGAAIGERVGIVAIASAI
jgi:hypothetical protein